MSLVVFLSGCNAIGFTKFAALQVTSTPQASVFLDGKHLGQTPFYSNQLKSGTYSLKITTSDATYLDKIELTEGTLIVVNRDLSANFLAQAGETLSLKPGLKGIMITSLPQEADITVDGRYMGKTPNQIKDIPNGDHKVLISKQDYVDREFTIQTLAKYQVLAEVTLTSKIAKGDTVVIKDEQGTPSAKVEITKTPQYFVRIYKEADTTSTELGRAKAAQKLDVVGENQDWLQVVFEGKIGWISKQFTKNL